MSGSPVSPARDHPPRQPRGATGPHSAAANPDLSACHMKTIIDSAGGGEKKLKAMRRRTGGWWRPAPTPPPPSPPSRRRHAPHPPGRSPSRSPKHRQLGAGGLNSPIYVELGFAWQRKQAESLRRLATAKGARDSPRRRHGKPKRLLTEPLPPPAATALSTLCSRAAFCVLLPAPRLPSAYVFGCI